MGVTPKCSIKEKDNDEILSSLFLSLLLRFILITLSFRCLCQYNNRNRQHTNTHARTYTPSCHQQNSLLQHFVIAKVGWYVNWNLKFNCYTRIIEKQPNNDGRLVLRSSSSGLNSNPRIILCHLLFILLLPPHPPPPRLILHPPPLLLLQQHTYGRATILFSTFTTKKMSMIAMRTLWR